MRNRMIHPSQVSTDNITSAQIGRAHKVYDCQTKKNFYLVENSRGECRSSRGIGSVVSWGDKVELSIMVYSYLETLEGCNLQGVSAKKLALSFADEGVFVNLVIMAV